MLGVGSRKQGKLYKKERRTCVVQGSFSKDVEKLGKLQKRATEIIWTRRKYLIKRDFLA